MDRNTPGVEENWTAEGPDRGNVLNPVSGAAGSGGAKGGKQIQLPFSKET